VVARHGAMADAACPWGGVLFTVQARSRTLQAFGGFGMSAAQAGYWLWAIWYVTWWIPALWSPKAKARPQRRGSSNLDRLATLIGAVLLFPTPLAHPGYLGLVWPLWRLPEVAAWGVVAVMLAGFGFCWWARVHLGRLWSGLVTLKSDHHIVDTGPYRLVRHPIYSGVMVSLVCLAVIKATPAALLGAALMILGFWMTARKEERFLRQELGEAAYDAYAQRTAMLAPGLY
jgi:protein-S-isoprenylcysteine O-methyltransferase Ste14